MADKAHSAGTPSCKTSIPETRASDSNRHTAISKSVKLLARPAPSAIGTLHQMLAVATTRADMEVFKHDFREVCHQLTQEEQFAMAGKGAARMFYIARFLEPRALEARS